MKNQTSVEWLMQALEPFIKDPIERYGITGIAPDPKMQRIDALVFEAKEMEKMQIKKAHIRGNSIETPFSVHRDLTKAEEYYQETYGSNHE
jgi:hypothetical protein